MSSIYNDRRMEAQDIKRGAPEGPRLLPVVSYDDEGALTTYTGKVCRVCACQLTSRNRYGTSTLCTEHGRELEKARVRRPSTAARRTRAATTAEAFIDPCPHRQAVHRALTGWLNNPMDECVYAYTIEVMREFELRARLLRALPPLDSPTDALTAAIESTP